MAEKPTRDATPLLIVKGTGPDKEPPPYHMNKPGIPPGAVPEKLKKADAATQEAVAATEGAR